MKQGSSRSIFRAREVIDKLVRDEAPLEWAGSVIGRRIPRVQEHFGGDGRHSGTGEDPLVQVDAWGWYTTLD